ncbi:hypothetical protein CAPTEDRAFT_199746 [Capitella teleta]|uniref:Uncharacterized protein n=1 Tax=Capitella teleta TaxID=283909 RepID=R7V2C6_CAPTE|nr:hypothetical protein CAPTEDRAFT_199746 [Capitella teleta]|eukprot:ELU13013.1 hypothetical protein CAPTEDRAFT_199746 [Capitella teleta]
MADFKGKCCAITKSRLLKAKKKTHRRRLTEKTTIQELTSGSLQKVLEVTPVDIESVSHLNTVAEFLVLMNLSKRLGYEVSKIFKVSWTPCKDNIFHVAPQEKMQWCESHLKCAHFSEPSACLNLAENFPFARHGIALFGVRIEKRVMERLHSDGARRRATALNAGDDSARQSAPPSIAPRGCMARVFGGGSGSERRGEVLGREMIAGDGTTGVVQKTENKRDDSRRWHNESGSANGEQER